MLQAKLEELKDRIETYFKDEHKTIVITKNKLECAFINSRFAHQFIHETEDIRAGYKLPRYHSFNFRISDNNVIIEVK